jgi:DNA-binding response OmpR family regulator
MHKAGRFLMFAKPYNFDELLGAIESMLPAQSEQPQQDSTSIRQKVLVIDDDKDFANALMLYLRSNHFDVKTSFDGINGIQEAIEQQPDIILLDLKLPAGDGFTVIHRCSVNTKIAHIPIIVITGNSDSGTREEVLNYGATAFFEKPVDFDVLLKNIRLILAGRKVPAGEKK